MTPLEIIKDAYDRTGIGYVVRKDSNYFYLVRCGLNKKHKYESMGFDEFISGDFIEFDENEEVAAY